MDSDSVGELGSLSVPVPPTTTTVSVTSISIPIPVPVPVGVHVPVPVHPNNIVPENEDHRRNSDSNESGQDEGDGDGNASTKMMVDTSVTDSLFPFIDELCLETKNIARFGVKLITLKIIDKKTFDQIMKETDEYARVYKLYNEAFELNAGKKLIQALQASGNGNVVEFIKQNVEHPRILFDIEEIQQEQTQSQMPIKVTQNIQNADLNNSNLFSNNLNSSTPTSDAVAAATLLLLDAQNNSHAHKILPQQIQSQNQQPLQNQNQNQHQLQLQQFESASALASSTIPDPVPVQIPSSFNNPLINTNTDSVSMSVQLQMSNRNPSEIQIQQQQQRLLQFINKPNIAGSGKTENATVNSIEDLIEQSLGLGIVVPQLLTTLKNHSQNSSMNPSVLLLPGNATANVNPNPKVNSNSQSVENTITITSNNISHNANATSRIISNKSNYNPNSAHQTQSRKVTKQKRKKKAAPEEWEKNRNKLLRMQGQEYMGYKKSPNGVEKSILIVRKKRSMGPPCNSPKCLVGKCTSCNKFTEEDRQDLFENFWLRMNWEQRKIYVASLVDVVTVKRHKKNLNEELRRTSSLRYMLKLNGEKQRVCKSMFLSTLGIGDYSVRSWVLKHGGRSCLDLTTKKSSKINNFDNNNSSSKSKSRRKKIKIEQELEQDSTMVMAMGNISNSLVNNASVNVPNISFEAVSVDGSTVVTNTISVGDGDNNCRIDMNNISTETTECSESDNNNSSVNSGAHFIAKDYFDSLVKLPQEYLNINIVQDQ